MSTFEQGDAAYAAGDYETAFNILMPLARQGDIRSQISIAGMYFSGVGVPKNLDRAITWYRLAAEQGHPIAQNNLAGILFESNPEEAIKWLLLAAENGIPFAQSFLGDLFTGAYDLPNHVQKKFNDNFNEALKWYKKSGEGGFAYAYHRLGEIYATGEGVDKNESEALKCYEQAANLEYSPSQQVLAEAYKKGLLGLNADQEKALFWLEKAQANETT